MNLRNKLTGLKEILKFDNWFSIIIQTLFNPNSRLFIYKLNGKEYLINKIGGDISGFRTIITNDEYKPIINKLKSIKQATLLDLGANVGGFAALLDSMDIQIKKIVAVEYNPNTFYRLGLNISNNFECEYHLLNKAVVGYERDINKNISLGGTGDNIYENTIVVNKKNIVIPGITFDQIYNEYFSENEIIDILKIDIEGAEYEIFEHGNCEQIKNCNYLFIEIHYSDNNRKDKILSRIKQLCFEIIEPNFSSNRDVYLFKNLNLKETPFN